MTCCLPYCFKSHLEWVYWRSNWQLLVQAHVTCSVHVEWLNVLLLDRQTDVCVRDGDMLRHADVVFRKWSRSDGFTLSQTSCRSCHPRTSQHTLRSCLIIQSGTERKRSSSRAGNWLGAAAVWIILFIVHDSTCFECLTQTVCNWLPVDVTLSSSSDTIVLSLSTPTSNCLQFTCDCWLCTANKQSQSVKSLSEVSPSPPTDNIRAVVIVWRVRGESIWPALCFCASLTLLYIVLPCVADVVSRPAWQMLVLLIARCVSYLINEHYYYYYHNCAHHMHTYIMSSSYTVDWIGLWSFLT